MAKRQFKGSARAKGFSPVSFSSAAEQRIAQQTSRVVEGMERYRDSDIKNRERVLNEMEKNAAATQRQIKRDQRILESNAQKKMDQIQGDERVRQQQAQVDKQATASIVKSVTDFSETAAKVADEFAQREFDEQYWEGVREVQLGGPITPERVAYGAARDAEGIATAKMEANITMAEVRGANPLAVSKARGYTYAKSMGIEDASILNTTKSNYAIFRDNELATSTELIELPDGTQIQIKDARGNTAQTAAAIQQVQQKFIKEFGLTQFSPARLGTALDFMQKSNETAVQQEAAVETNRNKSALKVQALNTFSAGDISPIDANNSFNALVQSFDGNFQKAFNELESGVSKGLIPAQTLQGIVMPDGRTFGETPRYEHMLRLETKHRLNVISLDKQKDQAAYEEKSNEWLALLNQEGASQADLEAAAVAFSQEKRGAPEWLKKRIAGNDPTGTATSKAIINVAEDAAARGMLTLDMVNKVFEANPIKGQELRTKLDEQNKFVNNDTFKQYQEGLQGLVKQTADAVDTVNTVAVTNELQKQYTEKVTEKVAGGMSIEDASRQAAFEIKDSVAKGADDPKSTYFRSPDPATLTFEYPNLTKPQDASKGAQDKGKALLQALSSSSSGKIQSLLSTPNAIFNNQQLERLFVDYEADPANFKFPASVQMIADRTNQSPMTLLNTLMGKQIGKKIVPPPSMRLLEQASPAARALLQKHKSANRSIRGLGMTSTGFNSEVIPPIYVPMIEQAATTHSVPAPEISALAEIESSFRPEVDSYNGSSFGFMQINKSAHPEFFATQDWRDPQANINYGAKYYSDLKKQFGGDPVAAAMAYNAGPGNYKLYLQGAMPDGPKKTEMLAHGRKFAKALYKYQGNSSGMLQSPSTMRVGSPLHVYTTGNIGPTSTGPHLDVKRTDRGEFNPNALDEFVEVEDPELGRVPLGQVPVTGDFASHTVRGSHGIDYGTYSGSDIYLKNGAEVVSTTPSEHGDVLTIKLPNGQTYTLLHGTSAN